MCRVLVLKIIMVMLLSVYRAYLQPCYSSLTIGDRKVYTDRGTYLQLIYLQLAVLHGICGERAVFQVGRKRVDAHVELHGRRASSTVRRWRATLALLE